MELNLVWIIIVAVITTSVMFALSVAGIVLSVILIRREQ